MAIVKFVSSGCPMNNIFSYVMRDEATEQRLIDGVNCSPDTAMEEFRYVKQKYGNPDLTRPYHWAHTTVRKMLSNQEYVGDTVNFKTYSKSNKLKKRLKNSPENMLIFENTHEAIVSRKVFDIVQKHFAGRKRPDKQGEMDKYAGYACNRTGHSTDSKVCIKAVTGRHKPSGYIPHPATPLRITRESDGVFPLSITLFL